MKKKERVLAYSASKELTNEELVEVAGGSAKMTTRTTQRMTGSYPGNVDYVVDQVVDW